MKKSFLYISVSFFLLAVFSCSNNFLNDNMEQKDILSGDSQIIISPSWDTDDYQFVCLNAGNANFTVERAPDWLEVETTTGKLTAMQTGDASLNQQSVGTIRCKAKVNPQFEKTGLYLDNVQISVNGKTCYVPVMYVSEGNPKINVNTSYTIDYNNYSYLTIQNTGEGILLWDIVSMPDWLTVDTNNFNSSNLIISQGNSYNLPLTFDINTLPPQTGNITGNIVLKTNDKEKPEVNIGVTLNMGAPQLGVFFSDAIIDFWETETRITLSFYNAGNGILTWSFEGLPDWLSISKSSGTTYYFSEDVEFTCNRALLPNGQSEAKIILKTNDADRPITEITVRARNGNNQNVHSVDGNIIDVYFDKNTDILYMATAAPNKILVYDTKSKNIVHEIALSKAPTCFAFSIDQSKIAVGHEGLISFVDLSNYTITKTLEINQLFEPIFDIVYVTDEYVAFTGNRSGLGVGLAYIHWLNLNTYQIDNETNVLYSTHFQKIPNTNYLVLYSISSNSLFITFDINTRTEKGSFYAEIGDFWLIKDGNYFIGNVRGNVYNINSLISLSGYIGYVTPSAIATLPYPNDLGGNGIPYLDYSPLTHSIWGLSETIFGVVTPQIFQFNDDNYSLVRTYLYDNYYSYNNRTYSVQAHYVFANGEGTELSVLRKATDSDNWSIEFIPVTN